MPEVEINETTGVATVGITEIATEVTIDETGERPVVNVATVASPGVVETGVIGPQGPQGLQGDQGPQGEPGENGSLTLAGLQDVNVAGKIDNSILYYDESEDKFIANDINTIITITDGGSF